MRRLLAVLLLMTAVPANAGLFKTDGCAQQREDISVGKKLEFTIYGSNDIGSDGVIASPGPRIKEKVRWSQNDKVQVNGEKIKWLKENFSKFDSDVVFFATVTQIDGSKSDDECFVMASFDGFDEKVEKKLKCDLDFEAIPEEIGSLSKVKELGARCEKYDPNSNFSLLFLCGQLHQRCGKNGEAIVAKWDRIVALENNSSQTNQDLRRKRLLAGTEKIQDFQDATLLHQPEAIESIMASPLLKPDSKIYGNKIYAITLDAQEKNNLLRGKIIFGESSYGEVNFKYVYLRTNAKTTVFHPDKLRIGATISVIGRYVSNATYTTLIGAEKMAPVIDVMFVE